MLKYTEPDNTKEAIIQAKFYMACMDAELYCTLQYGISLDQPQRWDLPDVVVVEHNQIIAIVEVKRPASFGNLSPFSKGQIERYKNHNVPVFILYSVYDIPYLIKELVGVRKKFLESTDPTKDKCFEADIQRKKKCDERIASSISKFDEAFPDYKFTSIHTLEDLATGVRILGLPDVLKLLDKPGNDVSSFFRDLRNWWRYRKEEKPYSPSGREYREGGHVRYFGTNNELYTLGSHCARQDRIDEKLS